MWVSVTGRDKAEFASQVMEFVRYYSMLTSIELAKERGTFPVIKGRSTIRKTSPGSRQTHRDYAHDWKRPKIDWEVITGILENGIRNAAQTTIAPTGTIATVAGSEGYGCEPVFALAYVRHVNDNGKDLQLTYTSPLFEQALDEAGLIQRKRRDRIQVLAMAPASDSGYSRNIRYTYRGLLGYYGRGTCPHAGCLAGFCR